VCTMAQDIFQERTLRLSGRGETLQDVHCAISYSMSLSDSHFSCINGQSRYVFTQTSPTVGIFTFPQSLSININGSLA
jgi:hypothetical protein